MNLLESPFSFLLKYTHLLNQKKKYPPVLLNSSSNTMFTMFTHSTFHINIFLNTSIYQKKKKKYSPLQFFPTPHQIQYPFNVSHQLLILNILNIPIY